MSKSKQNKQINSFLSKNRVLGETLKNDIESFLIREYNKKGLNFGPASPYGQILTVLKELNDMQYFYLEDALNERNIYTAFKQKSIFGLARLTGHNPHRGSSAKGEISIKFKPGVANEIPSNNIELMNFTKLLCENNSKIYNIILNTNSIFLPKSSNETFKFSIIEGELRTDRFIGNGFNLQSFNVPVKFEIIEQHYIKVFVNGKEMKLKESLYDISKDENAVIVKTGINGGLDVYFGNEDYGYIPKIGETIEVQWISSSGLGGNLGISSKDIIFKFTDEVPDSFGGTIDLNDVFDIKVSKSILMGSNAEDKELTKMLMNKNSRGLVLANPDNYIYFLSKYGQYKNINAFNKINNEYIDDNNLVYLYILPDINQKVQSNSDYFTTSESNFILSEDEKQSILDTIRESKQQLISTEVQIINPNIIKYALNIFLQVYDDIISEEVVKAEIIEKIGKYFLENTRKDKIPRSDLIKIIEEVDGVDSVFVEFISEKNESAIRNGFYFKKIKYNNSEISNLINKTINTELSENISVINQVETEKQIFLQENEDPNLGLDDFGDIIMQEGDLPLVRGGFLDRNGVEYSQGLDENNLCGINIIIKKFNKREN
jgi:hypothetical protein